MVLTLRLEGPEAPEVRLDLKQAQTLGMVEMGSLDSLTEAAEEAEEAQEAVT